MPSGQRERNAIQSDARKLEDGCFRFAIKISYDGTDYQGFQSQVHGNTIQDNIETRLGRLVRRPIRIFGWGRTDSGVHASGAVITVDLTNEEVEKMARNRRTNTDDKMSSSIDLTSKSLLSTLKEFSCDGGPGSISAIAVTPVHADFDARFSCLWKRYVYHISFGSKQRSPFLNRYTWQMDVALDVDKMKSAANILSGEHNFQWISVVQDGELRSPVRTLKLMVELVETRTPPVGALANHESSLLKISGICDFFLYRMMRRLVGILVAIGSGKSELVTLEACIAAYDMGGEQSESLNIPQAFLQTAPAKGLCLEHIEYPISINNV